jgi:hypothetical protein
MSADLDKAIDRAVREMLDVEPPAGLRGRVMARLESPKRHGAWWIWMVGPVAVAAAVLLAVNLWPRHQPQVQTPAVARGGDVYLAGETARRSTPPPSAPTVVARDGARGAQGHIGTAAQPRMVAAASLPGGETGIDPLDPIVPIAVATISPEGIAPAAIDINPLKPIDAVQIAPLTPPDGRH